MSDATQNAIADNAAPAPVTDQQTAEPVIADNAAPAPATDQQTADDTINTDDVQGSEPDGGQQSKAVKELIAQRKKRQQAEQEAAYWRGVAEGKEKPTPAPQVQKVDPDGPPPEPVVDDFSNYAEFERAEKQWIIDMAEHRMVQRQKQEIQRREEVAVESSFKQAIAKALKEDSSFADIINDSTLEISHNMLPAIQTSDVAPDVIKWLSANREEAQRIASLPLHLASKEIGVIETKIKFKPKPEVKKVSQAPAPIATVTPSGVVSVDESDLPIDQYILRRNKAQFGR